ncbi:MAG: hypothetical protein AAF628_07130 [Planctomycetota bacterium]
MPDRRLLDRATALLGRRSQRLGALAAAILGGAAPAQEPTPEPARPAAVSDERHFARDRSFSIVLPSGWRQLVPDEARTLQQRFSAKFPPDLLTPRQAGLYPYGPIDAWLRGEVQGRCLTLQKADGEIPVSDEGLADARSPQIAAGWKREVEEARIVELGPDRHPAIECVTALDLGPDAPPIAALELLVPTGGNTLILSFRCWSADLAAALPAFRATTATLQFARPARGESKLSDRLVYPAVVGALVGLLLLVLRKRPSGPAPG